MTKTHIGVISDTHGLLRPEAIAALQGVDFILHAGDIGNVEVLERLHAIAPVTAIRGNVDQGDWASTIPEHHVLQVDDHRVYMLHNVKELKPETAAAPYRVIISGHSHQPKVEEHNGVLFLNPGSAGPRRFKLPITLAYLDIEGPAIAAQIVPLVP